jgi:hypothetical protein
VREPRIIDDRDAAAGAAHEPGRAAHRESAADFAFTCDPLLGAGRVHHGLAGERPIRARDACENPRPWSTLDALLVRAPIEEPSPCDGPRVASARGPRAAAAGSSGADPGLAADADALAADAVDAG